MCETCSRDGTEERCPGCRPKRGKAEIVERRANAVRRSQNVRCRACEYSGPRFDQAGPLEVASMIALPFAFCCGVLPGLVLMSRASGVITNPCPACGALDEVVPAPPELTPTLEHLDAWTKAQMPSNRLRRRNQLVTLALRCSEPPSARGFSSGTSPAEPCEGASSP